MKFFLATILLASSALADSSGKLTLVVHHTYKRQSLELARGGLTTASGEQISITRLAYLLAEPALKRKGEEVWLTSRDWFGFADAARGDSTQVLTGVPRGKFDSLRFFIGPDAATDQADPNSYPAQHPLNPLVNNLHWGWAGGFVYLALEGKMDANGYSYHLAGAEHRAQLNFPLEVDLARDATVELDFHLEKLFEGPKPIVISEINSTHSRDGDLVATHFKTQVERAFSVRAIHETETAINAAANETPISTAGTPYLFTIPKGVPIPELPRDFPLTNERVALGQRLFHETRLSRDSSQSCASCHDAKNAFADRRRFSIGVDGNPGERNSMPLFNLAWKRDFFWDGRAPSLRKQALDPIQKPEEMHASLDQVFDRLTSDPTYAAQFARAFDSPGISAERIGIALEAFVITLTSFDSRFDRALRGQAQLTEEEKRGFQLFVTEYDPRQNQFGADCFHCHGGALFTDHHFHNNGLAPDEQNAGRARVTGRSEDEAKFATPSLRNVKLTAPYMHDGRFDTLAEVIEHYDHGMSRTSTLDPNLAKHPREGLRLTSEDKAALVAFLESLTDETLASK